jgi:hypothetical protein
MATKPTAQSSAIAEQNPPPPLKCTITGCTEDRADQSPEATNRHCRTHRNEATKRYLLSKAEQDFARNWKAGVEAMAEYLAQRFETLYPKGSLSRFSGTEIAAIIRRVDRPKQAGLASETVS